MKWSFKYAPCQWWIPLQIRIVFVKFMVIIYSTKARIAQVHLFFHINQNIFLNLFLQIPFIIFVHWYGLPKLLVPLRKSVKISSGKILTIWNVVWPAIWIKPDNVQHFSGLVRLYMKGFLSQRGLNLHWRNIMVIIQIWFLTVGFPYLICLDIFTSS